MSLKGFKRKNGTIEKYDINALEAPFTAEIGQVLIVNSIDENGYPNGFNAVDQSYGVEITDGEPTKENTVMTLDPNAEEINLCTEEDLNNFRTEVNNKLQNLPSGSGVTSWNDLKDKPFGELEPLFDITWNGDMDGLPILDASSLGHADTYFVKVSDDVYGVEDVLGGHIELTKIDGDYWTELDVSDEYFINTTMLPGTLIIHDFVAIIYSENDFANALGIPSGIYTNGVYFVINSFGYVSRFTALIKIKKIDEKYLTPSAGKGVAGEIFKLQNDDFNTYDVEALKGAEVFNLDENRETTNKATGEYSHAEGWYTEAIEDYSHAEGSVTTAGGECSHSEGYGTKANGYCSHAEGNNTRATGRNSHAEGNSTRASGNYSHAEGLETKASGNAQHVQGKYNIEDTENKYAHIVGNGSSTERSNAHTLDWDGNAEYAGDVIARGCGKESPVSLIGLSEDFVDFKARFDAIVDGSEVAW